MFSVLKKLGLSAVLCSTLAVFIMGAFYFTCPRPDLHTYTTYSKALFDDEQRLLRLTLAADDRYRLKQKLGGIADNMIKATLLYEDKGFYQHAGVDTPALLRAFWMTYISRERRVGASTINMQLARLRWQIPSSSVSGKLEQIIRAVQLSRHYSKDEILEAYFNHAPYGRNIEGIAAASLIYFNKTPDRLTWPEAMSLAVIPQNPNRRDPSSEKGYANIVAARERLMGLWKETYPDEKNKASFLDIPLRVRSLSELPYEAPHFSQYILETLPRWYEDQVHTSLNLNIQHILERGLQEYVQSRNNDGIENAAALLLNYENQEIVAMVGSADFNNAKIHGQVNGALAKRSPGSALKPFVYALAMDEGLIHPMTMLRDAKTRFGGFTPENYDRKFLGPVFAKTALIESRNVPAVDLQARLSSYDFHDFLQHAGVSDLQNKSHYGLALALGGGEVSMLEMAQLYGILANGGVLKPLRVYQSKKQNMPKKLLSPEASFLVLDILRSNPPPIDRPDFFDNRYKNDIAWKTGTSWAFRDAWAVGISGPYVLVTWVGNFDGSGNAAFIGRQAAGPLLFSLFNAVYPDRRWRLEDSTNTAALNIKKVEVCAISGDLPNKHCPRTLPSWFIPGVSPIKISNIHRAIPIDRKTGLRACSQYNGDTENKVYEFWPSDFLQLFQLAGISLKTPPKYLPECDINEKSSSGQAPLITSPISSIEYSLQSEKQEDNTIPFSAVVDSDVEQLFWFVDGHYAGKSQRGETFTWAASVGRFRVSVVDDSGRAGAVNIRVGRVN